MKKSIPAAVCALLVLLCCIGCSPAASPEKDTDAATDSTEAAVPKLTLFENGLTEYAIVRSDDASASDAAYHLAIELRNAFRDKFGDAPRLTTDLVSRNQTPPEGTPEILVGETNRSESAEVQSSLKGLSYAIRVIGNRVVICGSTDAMLSAAIDAFIATYITPADNAVQIPEDTNMLFETDILHPNYDEAHAGYQDGSLTIYPVAACYTVKDEITVTVNGHRVPLIENTVDYDYCSFAISGKAEISITVPDTIHYCYVSPLAKEYSQTISGNTVTFTMEKPEFLIVEIDKYKKIVIAADEPETDVPQPNGENVYCVAFPENGGADPSGKISAQASIQGTIDRAYAAGGGIVYIPDGVFTITQLTLRSNVHLYLAPGAVLRITDDWSSLPVNYVRSPAHIAPPGGLKGTFLLKTDSSVQNENIRIYGRGTIDGNGVALLSDGRLSTPLHPAHVNDLVLEGIIIRDGGHWSTMITCCNNVTIRGTKHLNDCSELTENDAIDIICSQNVTLTDLITISEDDTISVKAYTTEAFASNERWMDAKQAQDNENILVENTIVWSACGAYKIGWGIGMNTRDVTFRDCYIYSCMTAIDVSCLHGLGGAYNITFENVDVERFFPRVYKDAKYGTQFFMIRGDNPDGDGVHNVTLRNVNVRGAYSSSNKLYGKSETAVVDGVLFDHVSFRGKLVRDIGGIVQIGAYVRNTSCISD